MKVLINLLAILFYIALSNVFGQQDWKIEAQLRHRTEVDGKDFYSKTGPGSFNLLRSRIGIKLSPAEKSSLFFQIQDSRRFGEELNTLTDGSADNLDLHQAYYELKDIFNKPVSLRAGRMEMKYGSERLIGAVGWHTTSRSFDGFLLKFHTEKAQLDVFHLNEVEKSAVENAGDANILGIYGDLKFSAKNQLHGYLIWQRKNPSKELSRYTLGLYDTGASGNFHYEAEAVYQSGKITIGRKLDVSAYMMVLNFGFSFSDLEIKPDLTFGMDILSGDESPFEGKYNVFNTLYATNHKYYGIMDYFTNIPVHTIGLGLRDIYIKLSAKKLGRVKADLVFHIFNSQKDYYFSSEEGNKKQLGKEIDLTLSHDYNNKINFSAGGSLFFPGKIFKEIKGEDLSTWMYVMSSVNF